MIKVNLKVNQIGGETDMGSWEYGYLASKSGIPGAIRTLDPLLRSYTIRLFSTNLEANLMLCACPCFSLEKFKIQPSLKIISAKLVP
jgi:hypothetical protein